MTVSPLFVVGVVFSLIVAITYVVNHVTTKFDLPKAGKGTEVFLAALTLTQAGQLILFALTSKLALSGDQRLYICVGAITMIGGSSRTLWRRFQHREDE